MHRWLAIGLACCSTVLAGHVDKPSGDWKELRSKNLHMGLSEERVDRTIEACRANKLSVSQTEDLFCPVYTAHGEGLPTDCVFLKIEEGLAKGISFKEVHRAADKRLACLRQADELIMAARKHRGGQHTHLVMHSCMALESGLPADVLQNVLNRPGGFRYGRMIHVVEAGESLKLAGLTNDETLLLMNECLDRDLTGAEVFRVVDYIKTGLHKGHNFDALHQSLWVAASN